METLSKRKRQIYLITLTIIFVIGAPLLVLYSIGYRFENMRFITRTGGITVRVNEPNVSIYINNEKKRESNFFQKTYFFQSIQPGKYSVRTEKQGFFPWETKIEVYPEYVTEVYPFIIEEKTNTEDIPKFLQSGGSGAGVGYENKEYNDIEKRFSSINHIEKGKIAKAYKDMVAEIWNNNIIIVWNGKESSSPYYFCGFLECSKKIVVPLLGSNVIDFDFFPYRDDVFLVLKNDGLYGLAIDSEQSIQWFPLYFGKNIKFFVEDRDTIYIKNGEEIKKLIF